MIRHYETDSYLKECRAAVVSCEETQGGWLLELDESIFFPEEGGQNADTGILKPEGSDREIKLLDGQIGKDGRVRYLTEEPIAAGTAVTCLLDFEKRFSRMQQHSGEHIVSGLVHKTYGYDNVGFHLSDDNLVTLDFNGLLSYEQAMELEMRANQAVWATLPVWVLFPSREELAGLDYRSKKEIDGQVRLVEVGEGKEQIDLCACCAPHVASTCEIGMIRILQLQNYKGGVRMGILCGKRALEHEQREWKRLTDIARSLSTGVGQIPESVEALQQEIDDIL